jgi:membrane fusion protein, multidrug efflux system
VRRPRSAWRRGSARPADFCVGVAAAVCLLSVTSVDGFAGQAITDTGRDAVRGIVRAANRAMISTELQARASQIAFREGDSFKKGDILIEFDCRKQKAELAAAEAQQQEMKLNYENYKVLQRAQAAGRHEIQVSEVRAAKASAEADVLRARIAECVVLAPFDGRVAELGIYEHETPQAGKPFIGLIADGAMEIDLIVPSQWAALLTAGTEFKFEVEETKSVEAATIVRIGAAVDPISQTIKIVAVFKSEAKGVLPGMSGTGHFSKPGG